MNRTSPAELESATNRRAIAFVRARAQRDRDGALVRIGRVLDAAGIRAQPEELCAGLLRVGVLTINFHPDRIASNGRRVAAALAANGVYRSQFETSISSGGLTAHTGGDRDRWEETLFGGAYQSADEIPAEAPPLPEPRRWAEFCGAGRAAELARSVISRFSMDGRHLDAAAIGRAAASVTEDLDLWRSWDDSEDAPTRLKDLWHILVAYGRPIETAGQP